MPENLPPLPPGARSVVLSADTYRKLRAVAASRIIPDPTDFETVRRSGDLLFKLRAKSTFDLSQKGQLPPFWPTLIPTTADGVTTYKVVVTEGMVYERDLTKGLAADALTPHFCPAQFDAEDLHPFPITAGQAVYVRVHENAAGAIGIDPSTPPSADEVVDMVVLPWDTVSTNYIPGVQIGVTYYKICELQVHDGVAELVNYWAGSHIIHTCGLTCDVVLEDCNGDPLADPPVPGTQILRMTFLSGHMIRLDIPQTTRALAPATSKVSVPSCCWVGTP